MKVKISSVSYSYCDGDEDSAPQPIIEVQSIDEALKLIREGNVYPQITDESWIKSPDVDKQIRNFPSFIVIFPKGNQEWRRHVDGGRDFDVEIELYDWYNE